MYKKNRKTIMKLAIQKVKARRSEEQTAAEWCKILEKVIGVAGTKKRLIQKRKVPRVAKSKEEEED